MAMSSFLPMARVSPPPLPPEQGPKTQVFPFTAHAGLSSFPCKLLFWTLSFQSQAPKHHLQGGHLQGEAVHCPVRAGKGDICEHDSVWAPPGPEPQHSPVPTAGGSAQLVSTAEALWMPDHLLSSLHSPTRQGPAPHFRAALRPGQARQVAQGQHAGSDATEGRTYLGWKETTG